MRRTGRSQLLLPGSRSPSPAALMSVSAVQSGGRSSRDGSAVADPEGGLGGTAFWRFVEDVFVRFFVIARMVTRTLAGYHHGLPGLPRRGRVVRCKRRHEQRLRHSGTLGTLSRTTGYFFFFKLPPAGLFSTSHRVSAPSLPHELGSGPSGPGCDNVLAEERLGRATDRTWPVGKAPQAAAMIGQEVAP